MSWHLKSTGPKAAVKAAVLSQSYMPEGIKQAVVTAIDGSSPELTGARFESHGHIGGTNDNIGRLELELFVLAELPKPVEVAAAPAADAPAATEAAAPATA